MSFYKSGDGNKIRLSNRVTFFYKFIVPTLSYIAGIIINYILFSTDNYPLFGLLFVALSTAYGFLFYIHTFYRIKVVSLDIKYLYVSNFRKEIKIPLKNIKDVEFSRPFARINFKVPTEFGSYITYAIKYKELYDYFLMGSGSVESLDLLRRRVEESE